ncbi:MAG: DUF5060 domain-containing protein [Candidatus Brocadiia bacterium]
MGERAVGSTTECWEIFELSLEAEAPGNPFTDVEFAAVFRHDHRQVSVEGFYDGKNTFRARFMPDVEGEWRWRTVSDCAELDGREGSFTCTPPSEGNHGPVRVADRCHFRYADGTPYYQVGTTCYAWCHQGDELEEQTLRTLAEAPFNKLRMCVFPKSYVYNQNEPEYYPFQGEPLEDWDFTRFEPAFWRHFEKRLGQLRDMGIEADLILFHPYDRWGFSRMPAEADDRYLRYAVARLAAYRNVWWSMANEWDFMGSKEDADWDRYFRIVQESDPYEHLRGIHNGHRWYDHGKPWVTHCSVQAGTDDVGKWRRQYGKPVVVDECCYEGDIPQGWGNISARELVHRFWAGLAQGGYVGHGETYLHPDDILWWSKGGVLHGDSPERIAFMRRILEEGPQRGFDPLDWFSSWSVDGVGKGDDYVLLYTGIRQPAVCPLDLPHRYEVDVIDTWEMTVETLEGTYEGECEVPLPGKSHVALRLRRADG